MSDIDGVDYSNPSYETEFIEVGTGPDDGMLISQGAIAEGLIQWPVEDPADFVLGRYLDEKNRGYVWALLNDPRIVDPSEVA